MGDVLRDLYDVDTQTFAALWRAARTWPPDAFAIAYLLLAHHAIYRCAVSTDDIAGFAPVPADPIDALWPNQAAFSTHVTSIGAAWRRYANAVADDEHANPEPELVQFFDRVEREVQTLLACPRGYTGANRISLSTLFCLLASADEACAGLGLPGPAVDGAEALDYQADLRLLASGHFSLSQFDPHVIRVLPKTHTPQRGMTMRSLTHHVCATTQDFGVVWDKPTSIARSSDERLNLLLLPWPLRIDASAVRPAPDHGQELPEGWGYFDWNPTERIAIWKAAALVRVAEHRGLTVDGVVLPEAALTEAEAAQLKTELAVIGVKFVLTGVRGKRLNASRLYLNGYTFEQGKHHRWCLDRAQIEQYKFQRSLSPFVSWWENIALAPRTLRFVAMSSWLTICHVICEDLARLDPVDQIIRSVGPNLLIALLQDGPQLKQRWGARYASVYADDPGTSVLTMTSLGMAMASTPPPNVPPRRCIALWSDPHTGTTEIDLEPGHEAVWISLCARRITEFTADGRSDHGMSSQLVLVDHRSLKG